MNHELPRWAMERATALDHARAERADQGGTLRVVWPAKKGLRAWAKAQGWPTPWLGFDGAFLRKMLESEATFARAIHESGVELHIPIERHVLTEAALRELDELYEARGSDGRPSDWGALVGGLRQLRRLVEAGIVVEVEGKRLRSWNRFYGWAHGRYHMLEDGYDSWIGDDDS